MYEKLQNDARYYNFLLLYTETIEERQFAKWELALQNLDHVPTQDEPGYSHVLEKEFNVDELRKNLE